MMTYRVSGLDWCVIDTRRILAGPFPTLKAALGEVERRTTRTWVPRRRQERPLRRHRRRDAGQGMGGPRWRMT